MIEAFMLILKWYMLTVTFVSLHILAYLVIRDGIREGLFK